MSISASSLSLVHSQSKITILAAKYKRYCNKASQQPSRIEKIFKMVGEGCRWIWVKVLPVPIRGWASDFEQFNHYWKNEIGKPCSREQISALTVEDSLFSYQGSKTVLALLYSPLSFRTATAFVGSLPIDQTSKVLFCPLNIESSTFQDTYQDKVGFYNESVLVLWKGLFDEIIVLGKFRMGEHHLWQQIVRLVQDRTSYQGQIKKKAFQNMSSI